MPVTEIPKVSAHVSDDQVEEACAACPHPRTAHDGIAARFCSATVVGGYDRGCVCSPAASTPAESTGTEKAR